MFSDRLVWWIGWNSFLRKWTGRVLCAFVVYFGVVLVSGFNKTSSCPSLYSFDRLHCSCSWEVARGFRSSSCTGSVCCNCWCWRPNCEDTYWAGILTVPENQSRPLGVTSIFLLFRKSRNSSASKWHTTWLGSWGCASLSHLGGCRFWWVYLQTLFNNDVQFLILIFDFSIYHLDKGIQTQYSMPASSITDACNPT